MGLPAAQRICLNRDFSFNRKTGRKANCGQFLLSLSQHENAQPPRLAVVAPGKVANAVKRNRARRRLRELFRLHQEKLPVNADLVIILRRGISELSFAEMQERFLKGLERLCREK